MERDKPIEAHYARLLTIEGFIDQFWLFLSEADTQEQAYELTERMYESAFSRRKYKSYESFLNCRNSYLNKRRHGKG